MQNKFVSLKQLLQNFIGQPDFKKSNILSQLRKNWRLFVSNLAAEHTQPYKIDKKKLYVSTDNSIWITELRFQKTEIINKIKEKYKDVDVRDIHFTVK